MCEPTFPSIAQRIVQMTLQMTENRRSWPWKSWRNYRTWRSGRKYLSLHSQVKTRQSEHTAGYFRRRRRKRTVIMSRCLMSLTLQTMRYFGAP